MAETRTFTEEQLTNIVDRSMLAGRIDTVEKIIKRLQEEAMSLFQSKEDKAAAALRDFADELNELKHVYNEQRTKVSSSGRKTSIENAAAELDAPLTVE